MDDRSDRLRFADQVLINAAMYLVTVRIRPDDNEEMTLETIRHVLPSTNDGHRYVGPLRDSLVAVFEARRRSQSGEYSSELFRVARALNQIAQWRCAHSYEAFQDQQMRAAS